MTLKKAGRIGTKTQLRCNRCKGSCLPKNGDWFQASDSGGQVFLCRNCERSFSSEYQRTIPIR